jgi:hypothetical protein
MPKLLARVSWVWVVIAWTLFLWVSRLRNVLNNDELSSGGRAVRVAVVVIFVALAAMAAVAVRRKQPKLIVLFLGWTVGYWLIRGIGILIDGDYSVGFKAVHTVLMTISLTLSALAARQLRLRR